jgi:hypothetical protein
MASPEDWAPEACTLPTEQRPFRIAEFDDLFGHVLRWVRRAPTLLELAIPADLDAAVRDLARRESECCSFFTFEFDSAGADVVMRISVPPARVEVLDALQARVASR